MLSTLHIQKQKTKKNEKLRIRNEKHCHTCLHDDIEYSSRGVFSWPYVSLPATIVAGKCATGRGK